MKHVLLLAVAAGFLPVLMTRVCADGMFYDYCGEVEMSYPVLELTVSRALP